MKWICEICGYEHEGDAPPDVCPLCGVDSSNFRVAEEAPKTADADAIKTSIRQISYGIFVVATEAGGKINGQAANTVAQLTSEPNQLAVCLNKNNYTTELVLQSGRMVVHVMGLDAFEVVANFGYSSGRDRDKFAGFEPVMKDGLPCLMKESLSGMICRVVEKLDVGSHYLFVVSVEDGFVNKDKAGVEPMTYADFRAIKSGKKVAKAAPAEAVAAEVKPAAGGKYVCRVCGFVYDPAVEGMAFEDQPDTYVCPVCGAPKSEFDPVSGTESAAPEPAAGGKYICRVCGFIYDPAVEGMAFEDQPDTYVCPICGAPKSEFDPVN